MTESASAANAAQVDYWNTRVGETWVQFQQQLDRQLLPLGEAGMNALALRPGERVLDIGCGCGHTTLELVARVGPQGLAAGVDISRLMLEVARARAPAGSPLSFLELDAQTTDLAKAAGIDAFDAAFSRFGVMFFSDPVAAFANIRLALRAAGRLVFVCWRPLAENAWMRLPLEAAQSLLPPMPVADPFAPGPFAFADADRVTALLRRAGFSEVSYQPCDTLVSSGDLDQTTQLTLRVGPLGAALREHPQLKDHVTAAVRGALARHVIDGAVRMPAAVWIFQARNS